ncbi:Uma2 family endonuclease [Chloroflexi bacterium TSY]|nr:Uma2 family endonuclease [Chloroflexi bacterium TSY]
MEQVTQRVEPTPASHQSSKVASPPNGAQPELIFPRQGEWTYEHWVQLPDDGWKYEVIDGVLHMSPPPAIIHQDVSGELYVRMRVHARRNQLGKVLEAPCGVRLPNQPVPVEPDILFVKRERQGVIGQNYVEGAPDLIVEILSSSNPNHDLETKYAAYQEAGVPEYWIVDYQEQTITVYHLDHGAYKLAGLYTFGDTLESRQLDGFLIPVAELFDLD